MTLIETISDRFSFWQRDLINEQLRERVFPNGSELIVVSYTDSNHGWMQKIEELVPLHRYSPSSRFIYPAVRLPGGNDKVEAAEFELRAEQLFTVSRVVGHPKDPYFHISISTYNIPDHFIGKSPSWSAVTTIWTNPEKREISWYDVTLNAVFCLNTDTAITSII